MRPHFKLPLYRPCLQTQSHAEMLGVSTSADGFGNGQGTTAQSITTVSFTAPNTLEGSLSFSLPSSLLIPLPSPEAGLYVDSGAVIQSWKDLRPNNEIALLAQVLRNAVSTTLQYVKRIEQNL